MTSFDRALWPKAIPALLTPFADTGAVDLDAHAHNLRTVRTWGGSGILIAGSTGEGPYLEPGERASLIETTRRSDPTMLLIAGVHAESLRQATALVDECSDADAVLVVTPTSLVRGNTRAIETFYVDLADRCRIPLLLYSVPSVTGYELPVDSVRRLTSHPNIVGMKDSGGDPSRLPQLAEAIGGGFTVYAGASRALSESGSKGAWGAITGSGNYALGDVALAIDQDASAQRRLTDVSSAVERYGVAGTKAAAGMVGLEAGQMRRPLLPLDDPAIAEVRAAVDAAGLTSQQ